MKSGYERTWKKQDEFNGQAVKDELDNIGWEYRRLKLI